MWSLMKVITKVCFGTRTNFDDGKNEPGENLGMGSMGLFHWN